MKPESFFPEPRLKSAWPQVVCGKLLTDKRIAHYIRQGYYGEARKAAYLAAQAAPKPKKARSVSLAMDFLSNFLK